MKRKLILTVIATLCLLLTISFFNVKTLAEETATPLADAEYNLSSADFTTDSLLIDPETVDGTGNFGGHIYSSNIVTAGTDGIAIRVKNLTSSGYAINTLYFHCVDLFSYSLMSSNVTFLSVDGSTSTYKAGPGGRNTVVPANFDGVMIVPWSELVNIRAGGAYNWTYKTDEYKLSKTSEVPDLAYPTKDIVDYALYFNKGQFNAGTNELLIGNVYTITNSDVNTVTPYTNPFILETTTLPENNVLVSSYPTTQATYSFQVNGISGVFDDSINLNLENNCTLGYGYSITLNPTLSTGYALSYIEYDGEIITNTNFTNLNKLDSNHVINVVTTEYYSYQIGTEDSISLTDKTGVLVDVTNGLTESVDYSFMMTGLDNTVYTASSQGNGIFVEEGGNIYYGNVFSIPVGFTGQIYIPFNVYRGSTYGGVNNIPFDLDKPETVQSTIRLSYVMSDTITKEALESVFSNWQFVTNAPELTLAPEYNFASENPNSDLVGGVMVGLDNPWLNYWTSAPSLKVTPSESISMAGLGMGFRVRNISDEDIALRIYFIGSNGAWYVPNTSARYHLVNPNGTSTTNVTNRNVIIPAGFDGTAVINFADYATDGLNVIGENGSNVVRTNINVSEINMFMNANQDDKLFIGSSLVNFDLDGTESVVDSVFTLDNTTGTSVTKDEITSTVLFDTVTLNNIVTLVNDEADDNTKVTVDRSSVMYGDTLTVTPKEGFMIEEATLNDVALTENPDGSFSITVSEAYLGDVTLSITVVEKVSLIVTFDSTLGNVTINDEEVNETLFYDMNDEVTLVVTPITGYQIATVMVGEDVISGENGSYSLTLDTSKDINVTFELITYTVTYVLDGGINSENNPTTYTILDSFILSDANKEGFEFLGWYTLDGSNAKVDALRIQEGTTGNITFYADFEEIIDDTPVEPTQPTGCNALNAMWLFIIPLFALAVGINRKFFK